MSNVDNSLYPFFKQILLNTFSAWGIDLSAIDDRVTHWIAIYWYVAIFLSAIFFAGIIYFTNKVIEIRRFERERVYGQLGLIEELKENLAVTPPVKNQDWEKIMKLIGSDSPNDWQKAIIDADKMLEIVVNTFSVPGDNIGDKLKNIERGDFNTLNEAWQAHKIRNQIAHEHNFHLSQRDARLAIDNFEKVFREFDFI